MKALEMFLISVYKNFWKEIVKAFCRPFISKDRTVPGEKTFTTYIGIPWIKGE